MRARFGLGYLVLILALVAMGRGSISQAQGQDGVESSFGAPASLYVPLVRQGLASAVTRVSISSDGGQGSGTDPSISDDGRYVAFASDAGTLVPEDVNGRVDVFVHDRLTGDTSLLSRASDGDRGNDDSVFPAISGNGRFIAFHSFASTLVEGDTNGSVDVFVHDMESGITERVSVSSDAIQGDSVSDAADITADGRFVVFQSAAGNLVSGDSNGTDDIFMHDRETGETTRHSVTSTGQQASGPSTDPAISADGRIIAFVSEAEDLVANDTNNMSDLFVHDRQNGQTTRLSLGPGGVQGDGHSYQPALSADGRYVAFVSLATNLVANDTNNVADVFIHDRQSGNSARISVSSEGAGGDSHSYYPTLSGDGRAVAFWSAASTLAGWGQMGSTEIYLRQWQNGITTRLSSSMDGSASGGAANPAISGNGRVVAFQSGGTALVPGDTNEAVDIFVVELP